MGLVELLCLAARSSMTGQGESLNYEGREEKT